MDKEINIDEINDMIEIYNGNIQDLSPEDAKLTQEKFEEKRNLLVEELERLYETDQIGNSGKISMLETTMSELDGLLEQISVILPEEPEEVFALETEEVDLPEESTESELEVTEEVTEPEKNTTIEWQEPSEEFLQSAQEIVGGREGLQNLLGVVEEGSRTATALMQKIKQSEKEIESEETEKIPEREEYDKGERVK